MQRQASSRAKAIEEARRKVEEEAALARLAADKYAAEMAEQERRDAEERQKLEAAEAEQVRQAELERERRRVENQAKFEAAKVRWFHARARVCVCVCVCVFVHRLFDGECLFPCVRRVCVCVSPYRTTVEHRRAVTCTLTRTSCVMLSLNDRRHTRQRTKPSPKRTTSIP